MNPNPNPNPNSNPNPTPNLHRANAWMSALLQERGPDIYRMKGILAMHGHSRKFLFQVSPVGR